MPQDTGFVTTEVETEEHSMRVVEYALAFAALITAGILAFIR